MDVDIPVVPVVYAQPIPPPVAPAAAGVGSGSAGGGAAAATGLSLAQQQPRTEIDETQIARLQEQGFTRGLAKALSKNAAAFPLRIWVVDNSGSMNAMDGNRIVPTTRTDDVKVVPCTRWREIQGTIEYHVQMAALLRAPTVFRMLNNPGATVGPQQFGVADKGTPATIDGDVQTALSVMTNASPGGVTPLVRHINEIRNEVSAMAPELSQRGQRVVIVLATDGLPTDERGLGGALQKQLFTDAMRSLEGLPVWIVIRLCTDDDEVVEFYNDIDTQLELSVEVLDDFISEAKEVHKCNKWLNYALPLHRIREMGFHDRLFDLLEERRLTKDEIRDFCFLLFGEDQFDGVPDAAADFKGFAKAISKLADKEKNQWNPAKKKVMPWIDVKALKKQYADSCSVM